MLKRIGIAQQFNASCLGSAAAYGLMNMPWTHSVYGLSAALAALAMVFAVLSGWFGYRFLTYQLVKEPVDMSRTDDLQSGEVEQQGRWEIAERFSRSSLVSLLAHLLALIQWLHSLYTLATMFAMIAIIADALMIRLGYLFFTCKEKESADNKWPDDSQSLGAEQE